MHFSFSVASPTGVVFWGLVAIAIAWLGRVYREALTPRLQRLLLRFPRRIIPILTRIAYFVYPTWRSYARGGERIRAAINIRISQLNTRPRMPVMLVGGVYLDIHLTPVPARDEINPNMEYSDLDTVPVNIGGACFFVGKYLWEGFTRRSHLFSQIGKGDMFSRQLSRLIKEVPWIRDDHIPTSKNSQCGVSIHLLDREGRFTPTFTHKGALGNFRWKPIIKSLQHCGRRGGGVLYISSFFRTSLSQDLATSIRSLSPNILVILDHGRFQPTEHPAAMRTLTDAFSAAMVDIYICTYGEIYAFATGAGLAVGRELDEIEVVRRCAKSGILPKVTVVRGDQNAGQPTALLAIDNEVQLIKDGPKDWHPQSSPGIHEAFTAGFINYLYSSDATGEIEDIMVEAVRAGLKFWAKKG